MNIEGETLTIPTEFYCPECRQVQTFAPKSRPLMPGERAEITEREGWFECPNGHKRG